ncbi:hypothetical protein PL757_18020, partial [Phocaeicola vulgatus]|uniref:hypothetical protein n=1 Tax=Phocaeicola vulgatus TaxID=821 RepID=UPI001E6197CB
IDGISFIEHLSFKAFNEGIRLKDCIRMQQKLMNVRVRCVAADSIITISRYFRISFKPFTLQQTN